MKNDVSMIPVQSSNVLAVGYDDGTHSLVVRFKANTVYVYQDVPVEKFDALLKAESVGKFINSNIKGTYPFRKVV